MKSKVLLLILSLWFPSALFAADAPARQTVKILGRGEATVTTESVRLSDIAEVHSEYQRDNEAVIALRKIVVAQSPEPGERLTLSAAKILGKLREEGVNLKQVGYAIPRTSTVLRAGRALSLGEIQEVITEALANSNFDATIQSIEPEGSLFIAPGLAEMSARIFPGKRSGELAAVIEVKSEGAKQKTISARVIVDQWMEVPVANRPLAKGSLIGSDDLMMARLNVTQIPRDAAYEPKSIIGLETKSSLGYGEVFRKRKLEIPPVVATGSRLTLRYKSAALEATASGVAMEDGIVGQRIRVRNEGSGKVIVGEVIEAGLVGVTP